MRINIDKHTNTTDAPLGAMRWVISAGSGERQQNADGDSYWLEIDHDFSGDPDRVTRVIGDIAGERMVILPDDEFSAAISEWGYHQDDWVGVTHGDATEHFNDKLKRFSYSQARVLGHDPQVFDDMLAAWQAANQFMDFGVTL